MATKTRSNIGAKVRQLRLERRLTQSALAKLLGLSQNYLSVLERGDGSFTAEQLLTVLRHFNVPVDYFASEKAPAESQIQNTLAREGARHLVESEILPSERLKSAVTAIREALVSAESSRQVAAIAPVFVAHAGQINLSRLKTEFRELGLENRFHWAIENTLEAINQESAQVLPREWRLKYRRAELVINAFLAPYLGGLQGATYNAENPEPGDVLDPEITSPEALKEVSENLSPIAQKWRVITRIELDDFVRALRAARGAD